MVEKDEVSKDFRKQILVSVRNLIESLESFVIQEWWPDSKEVTDVDEQEPQALRP